MRSVFSSHRARSRNKRAGLHNYTDAHIGNETQAYTRKHKAERSGSYIVPRTDRGARTGNDRDVRIYAQNF